VPAWPVVKPAMMLGGGLGFGVGITSPGAAAQSVGSYDPSSAPQSLLVASHFGLSRSFGAEVPCRAKTLRRVDGPVGGTPPAGSLLSRVASIARIASGFFCGKRLAHVEPALPELRSPSSDSECLDDLVFPTRRPMLSSPPPGKRHRHSELIQATPALSPLGSQFTPLRPRLGAHLQRVGLGLNSGTDAGYRSPEERFHKSEDVDGEERESKNHEILIPDAVATEVAPMEPITTGLATLRTPVVDTAVAGATGIGATPAGATAMEAAAAEVLQVETSEQFWQVQVESIYRRRNPMKLNRVPEFLEKYRGREALLYRKVCMAYGLNPRRFYLDPEAWRGEDGDIREDEDDKEVKEETFQSDSPAAVPPPCAGGFFGVQLSEGAAVDEPSRSVAPALSTPLLGCGNSRGSASLFETPIAGGPAVTAPATAAEILFGGELPHGSDSGRQSLLLGPGSSKMLSWGELLKGTSGFGDCNGALSGAVARSACSSGINSAQNLFGNSGGGGGSASMIAGSSSGSTAGNGGDASSFAFNLGTCAGDSHVFDAAPLLPGGSCSTDDVSKERLCNFVPIWPEKEALTGGSDANDENPNSMQRRRASSEVLAQRRILRVTRALPGVGGDTLAPMRAMMHATPPGRVAARVKEIEASSHAPTLSHTVTKKRCADIAVIASGRLPKAPRENSGKVALGASLAGRVVPQAALTPASLVGGA